MSNTPLQGTEPQLWKKLTLKMKMRKVTAALKSQEAKKVRDIGSRIFETPVQHDYEAGVEVRSLLSSGLVKEIHGKLAVTDVDSSRNRLVKSWIDDLPSGSAEEPPAPLGEWTLPLHGSPFSTCR